MTPTASTTITGPAGTLEALVSEPSGEMRNIAVLCHPHPLYGGSMHDGVLQIAASALLEHNIAVVRFNFRGVGRSQGISGRATPDEKSQQAYAPPEVGDLIAVASWARSQYATATPLCVGYSFGAHVLWHALSLLSCPKALLIAPPTAAMDFPARENARDTAIHAVWCRGDDFVNPTRFIEDARVTTTELTGGNHFFSGQTEALARAVTSTLA
jgi:alpha/beta superfamily hydrolase